MDNEIPTIPRHLRLGEVLVEQGLLNESDVQAILDTQQQSAKPFGEIAESMFNISADAIEEAWACQYAHNAPTIDPVICIPSVEACALVTARQAWQFRCLPMNLEDKTLVIATTKRHLRRALRFATRVLGRPAYFVMTTEERLCAALSVHYPLCDNETLLGSDAAFNGFLNKIRMERLRETR